MKIIPIWFHQKSRSYPIKREKKKDYLKFDTQEIDYIINLTL